MSEPNDGSAVKKPLICVVCDSPNVGRVEKGVYECWECGAGWKTSEYREPYSKPLEGGSAVKSPLDGSALNAPSPIDASDVTFVDVSTKPKRRFSNADVGRANVAKRCLYGAACIVREALTAVKRGDYPLSESQSVALVEAEAAMTRLVDSWQKLPGSWQNREKNKWSRKSTSPVPTRVKHE